MVTMAEFDEAVERGAVGLERKSRIMHADEKQRVAYHEAGHALVACSLPNTHPVHKVSIIPRGIGALGYVLSRPDEDRYLVTQTELESRIHVALGGTLAEELIFREISNGATSDLEKASLIARSMVKEFGMSRLGRRLLPRRDGPMFLNGPVFPTPKSSTASAPPTRSTARCARSSMTPRSKCAASCCRAASPGGHRTAVDREGSDGRRRAAPAPRAVQPRHRASSPRRTLFPLQSNPLLLL